MPIPAGGAKGLQRRTQHLAVVGQPIARPGGGPQLPGGVLMLTAVDPPLAGIGRLALHVRQRHRQPLPQAVVKRLVSLGAAIQDPPFRLGQRSRWAGHRHHAAQFNRRRAVVRTQPQVARRDRVQLQPSAYQLLALMGDIEKPPPGGEWPPALQVIARLELVAAVHGALAGLPLKLQGRHRRRETAQVDQGGAVAALTPGLNASALHPAQPPRGVGLGDQLPARLAARRQRQREPGDGLALLLRGLRRPARAQQGGHRPASAVEHLEVRQGGGVQGGIDLRREG